MFVAEVRKLVGKKNLNEREIGTVKKAALVAALSSNHSWKTYKYLSNYCELDKEALANEFSYALREGWKRVTENDVEEVINNNFNPYVLSMWFYYAVDQRDREEYNAIYNELKKQLAYGLEPMEKRV